MYSSYAHPTHTSFPSLLPWRSTYRIPLEWGTADIFDLESHNYSKRRFLLDRPIVAHIFSKFISFYGTRKFIVVFIGPRNLCLSWANLFKSTPTHPISLISHRILSSHLYHRLPSGIFLHFFRLKCFMLASCPAYSIHFHFIILMLHQFCIRNPSPTFSLDSRLTDGGEVVSLTRRPPFTPQEDSWYSFLLEAGRIR
jgi:hypothetical protein